MESRLARNISKLGFGKQQSSQSELEDDDIGPNPAQPRGPPSNVATSLARYFSKLGFHKQRTYTELKEDEIRLITLQPGKQDSVVRCDIEVVSIDSDIESAINYEALSYAWGNVRDTKTIMVSNLPFEATLNLELALRNLRHEHSTGKLWVDAICINQQDDKERNAQVKLMAHIYSQASRVLVWFGQMDPQSELAFDMVELSIRPSASTFVSVNREYFPYAPGKGSIEDILSKLDEDLNKASHDSLALQRRNHAIRLGYNLYDFSKDGHALNEAIIHTFTPRGRYDWWRRLWVVQEVLCARDVWFVCGSRLLALHDIARVLKGYAYYTSSSKTRSALVSCLDHVLQLEDLRVKYGLSWNSSPTKSLVHLIKLFEGRECSDARDKIYSLLNLSSFRFARIQPDYRKSTAEVFAVATRSIIAESGSLNSVVWMRCSQKILLRRSKVKCLPTWVPDFSTWSQAREEFMTEAQQDLYDASKRKIDPLIALDSSKGILVLRILAKFVDTIVSISGPTLEGSRREVTRSFTEREPQDLDNTIYVNGERGIDAYWRTLLKDLNTPPQANRALERLKKDDIARGQHMYYQWTGRHSNLQSIQGGMRLGHTPSSTSSLFLDHLRYYGSVENDCFVGTKNGYMGLVEGPVRIGDSIFVAHGSTVPLVLRPAHGNGGDVEGTGGRYSLICRAYVHGIMDGELSDKMKTPSWDARNVMIELI
ncbi:hypothetical protein BP6252_05705 [Coleophoma cylindrospora]|uniref:Heterokaryon incompatibility domain-containing protein n=1 Tax=Coleophoma cylindrospora TaxID=1849047 RepID=A0A3D8RU80_9HELO|nr:hypothetical protein BP6252_05705 [Coleophoma cylindrospora]